jgi:transposase
MQTKLSCEERVNLVFLYAKMNASYRDVAAEFNRLHPARPPLQHTTLQRLITRFKSIGRADDLPRSGRPHIATGEEACTAVLASLTHTPRQSLRKLSHHCGISTTSVYRICKKYRFHPYKVQLTQELHGDDMDRRMEFCEWYCMQEHPWKRIVFSDEAIFYLNGHVNRHNCRYWCDNNPRWMEDSHVQNDPRVMVWAAIWHDRIIGPYFLVAMSLGKLTCTCCRHSWSQFWTISHFLCQ